jgi:hypothetical protein
LSIIFFTPVPLQTCSNHKKTGYMPVRSGKTRLSRFLKWVALSLYDISDEVQNVLSTRQPLQRMTMALGTIVLPVSWTYHCARQMLWSRNF